MDWSSLLSALIGGFFALAGVLISLQWTERTRRETRLNELASSCRALGMEIVAYLESRQVDEFRRLQPAFNAAALSLQAHLSRWKGSREHRGFAETIHELSKELAEDARGGIPPLEYRTRYIETVRLLVVACIKWESAPSAYAVGNIAKKLRDV